MAEQSMPTDPGEPDPGGTAARKGDDRQQLDIQRLITDYHAALYRYAFRLAGCEADAEDLTQQTFLVVQQKLHQVRDPQKVGAWLYSVLRSCYLKSHRKRTPLTAAKMELDIDSIPDKTPGSDEIDRQLLQAAINELPDEFKLVVVMFYFEECSYKEIAAQLEIPIGTVMSRLARAKGRLRHKLLCYEKHPDRLVRRSSVGDADQISKFSSDGANPFRRAVR